MTDKKPSPVNIEQEISKQIEEFDKKVDRGGMLYLLIIVVVIFSLVFFLVDFFSTNEDVPLMTESQTELVETLQQLESRIDQLEQRIVELESK